nr:Transmembrane protein [Ipomoea batatas]
MEDKSMASDLIHHIEAANNDHGWQKVSYSKKQKKNQQKPAASDSSRIVANGSAVSGVDNVFKSLEKQSEERRIRIEAQRAAMQFDDEAPVRSAEKHRSDDEDEDSDSWGADRGTAAKIDATDLSVFLDEVSESYESQQDILLMRFADYFGRAFSAVTASQFPWLKLFRESLVAKIADVPVSHLSEPVYKTSVDWINKRSYEALGPFVLWLLDSILADLAIQQSGSKVSKKGVQQTSSKSQVAIFLVLSMVLRRKPDVLINIMPTLRENTKYQGQDKLPVIVWMIAQACQGDLCVGLYLWAHWILPLVGGKSGSNPQTRDMILQSVERILSFPKARSILVNGAVRKGERLVPPSALDLLLRVTFPASSARVKATERFEKIYPTLKEIALAGSPGSKAMKQVSLQIFSFATKAAGEGIPELSKEGTSIFIWCLTQNAECFKQWDKIYLDNIEASVAALRKLTEEWRVLSANQSSLVVARETLKGFRNKNEKALSEGVNATLQSLLKDADKYCKVLLGRLSRGHACLKSLALIVVLLGVGAAVTSPDIQSWDWDKLNHKLMVLFNAPLRS